MINDKKLQELQGRLNGSLVYDDLHKALYATDASVYRKIPLAVAFPKDEKDLQLLIEFATQNKVTLICGKGYYYGQVVNSIAHGYGTFTYLNGDKYVGE